MIALVTTGFLVFYILVPGILFRFASSIRVRLKLFQRTRTQEATFSVAVALLPFVFALLGSWSIPFVRQWPFPVQNETPSQRRLDGQRVAALLTASDASHLLSASTAAAPPALAPAPNSAPTFNEYWSALTRVTRRQMRFLFWYFAAAALEGWFFGFLAGKYGDWQQIAQERRQRRGSDRRKSLRARAAALPAILFNWIAVKLILPNISEWHMLLTDFNWPKRDGFFVSVDILQNDEHLYQGRVADYFIDSDGKLTGILLKNVSRFDRPSYLEARTRVPQPESVTRDNYWRNIPSSHFYIGYSSILNLNVRFAPRDESLISLADKLLRQDNTPAYHLSMEPEDQTGPLNPHQPDIYA